jgi:UDP:flavonoid glycosyltransferase YjiC (YdhE family)
MKVLLLPFGSYGDVHPFFGLGLELKRRGHDIVMITNAHFRKMAEAAGFAFVETAPEEIYRASLENELLWHPSKGFPFLAENFVIPMIRPIYDIVLDHYKPGETIAVSGSLAFGARLAQEKLGLPLAVAHLQPSMFRTVYDPPVFSGIGRMPDWMPILLRRAIYRVLDVMVDRVLAPGINKVRSDLGLSPVHRIFYRWWHSPLLTLGLFPDWYGVPQKDWPPFVRVTGFPLFDDSLDPSTEQPNISTGSDAPIVFTAGTAMKVGQAFFRQSVQLCEQLRRPGLLLTGFPEQLPSALPANVRHVRYMPFSQLFPKAAVVVHHGGVGTTAQALRAGVPQLIVPMAYDQPDNAFRIERLGVGLSLSPAAYQTSEATTVLSRLLNEEDRKRRCLEVAAKFEGHDAIKESCDLIERTLF